MDLPSAWNFFLYLLLCTNFFFLGILPCMNFFAFSPTPPITFLMVSPLPETSYVKYLKYLIQKEVQARSGHRIRRRNYSTKGPNYSWHVDGYDKLKPFGFCLHGAINGYRRKILCLEVSSSNNDPGIITKYSLQPRARAGVTQRSPSSRTQTYFRLSQVPVTAGNNQ